MTNKELEQEVKELRKLEYKVNKIIESLKDYSMNITKTINMRGTPPGTFTVASRDFKLRYDMEELENG